MDGWDREVDLSVAHFEVDVGKAQMVLPAEGPVALHGLEGLGEGVQALLDLGRQLERLRLELGPELSWQYKGL